MLKKIYAALLVTLAAGTMAIAQSGALKGRVIDEANGEGISFANVQLEQEGNAVGKTVADIDGNFTIKPIPPGKYDLKAGAVGYQPLMIKGVIIGGDKTTYQDMKVKSTAVEMTTFDVVEYTEPLIDPDTKSGGTVTREEFQAMPSKNINSVAATTAGVFQRDEGDELNVRGARSEGTDYYIDGEKVRGTSGLPQASIEQVSVITGGVPAQYGDATGGFVNITTRGGVRNDYFGGIELISSQLTDAYDYNFAGFNVGGPLMAKKDSAGNKQAKIGFFLSGEVSSEKDADPSAVGLYKVKDEKLAELEETPLGVSETGGTLLNAELLRWEDLEKIKAKQNVKDNKMRVAGKLDFKINDKMTFTLGGSMDYGRYHSFVYNYSMLNPSNNPEYVRNTMRVYGKFTHRLGKERSKDDKATSVLNNAYYSLQVGYTKYKENERDDTHKDKYFDYGYIGKYETQKARGFALVQNDVDTIPDSTYYEQMVWSDTNVIFTAGSQNPLGANYTSQYYDMTSTLPNTLDNITQGYGLLNGARPRTVYSIWDNTGRQYGRSYYIDQTQLRVTGQFSADVKNHALQVGFEYEKRDDRYWQVAPVGLWTIMRQQANKHISQLDTGMVLYNGPIMLTSGTVITNPAYNAYAHAYKVNPEEQSIFDYNLRQALSLGQDEWIDIDSKDPSTFNLSLFSPDELLNDGNSLVGYYGYSYDGVKLDKMANDLAALEAFYKDKEAVFDYKDNNPSTAEIAAGDSRDTTWRYTRTIPSFQPVYVAGYIQDKFDIKDMKFNVGLRIDHFNANQPVLKDEYLLYETYTVGEDKTFTHPTSMPDDAVIYVDDASNPTSVLGYRVGDQWYNELGTPIADPQVITPSTGLIQPYLKYPNEKFLETSSVSNIFKMYEAQNTFMPRVAFAFPISDKANFFAHYDVLTQRPPTALRFDPTDYLYIQTVGGIVNNPALKPERTTDYEVGFSQVLNERKNAAITISAFYREMRDMIQQRVLYGAYPLKYQTYTNIDFGTVKGFSVAYDLRRTGNVQMTAAYTLQFADGTGSASNSASNIVANGQPNLRTTMPLDFDQRHAIVLNTDYRFGEGKDYNGPEASWAKMIFENFGGNLVFRVGSGLPYSRQQNVTSGNGDNSNAVVFGINQRTSLKGKLNGSNLPWQYRADLRLDKSIPLSFGKGGEDKAKVSNLKVYVQILNVLNTKNVVNLYSYTGDPDDDGYLSAPETQTGISNYQDPQSFRDLYQSKIANPAHYSIPRRIRVGIQLDF